MNKLLLALCGLMAFGVANAGCTGSGSMYSCYDYNTGNSYNVSKIDNQTHVNGYNSNTGSSWSQNSTTYGNTTYQNGYSSNGNSWNQTIRNNGSSTTYSGSDSKGNSFYKTCNSLGCF